MIKRLNKAIEALGWIYEGTRSTRRIRKTLVKLIQICTVLGKALAYSVCILRLSLMLIV